MIVQENSIWVNDKTKDKYVVLHIATAAWDRMQQLVIYQRYTNATNKTVWVRSVTEFLEKFTVI